MRNTFNPFSLIWYTLFSALLTGSVVSAQPTELEKEYSVFEASYQGKVGDEAFIDSTFMVALGLHRAPANAKGMKAWSNPLLNNAKDYIRVCDLRLVFQSNADAEAFHKKYTAQNSEYGDKITTSGIVIPGADDLRIFRESEKERRILKDLGLPPAHTYYFLFVIDKYVAKVFVNTKENIGVKEAVVFANEAARRLSAYAAKNK